ncbi:MAG: DUF6527 family protein [Thermoproteota archaeon]
MTRNVELEGPVQYSDLKQIEGEVYNVWFDCDCGRRMIIRASPSGPLSVEYRNIWKLEVKGDRLSVTPSILFDHGDRTCHIFIIDEPYKRTETSKMSNDD